MLGRRSNVAKKPRDVVQPLDTSLRIKNMRHFASVALQPINSIQPIRVLSISPWNSWWFVPLVSQNVPCKYDRSKTERCPTARTVRVAN